MSLCAADGQRELCGPCHVRGYKIIVPDSVDFEALSREIVNFVSSSQSNPR